MSIKGRHRPNSRLVKIHLNYTVEEIASLLGVHKNTVRQWIKHGLSVCDDRRPLLVVGRDLAAFLKTQRNKNKCKCQLYELYCLRCRKPQKPAGNVAEFEYVTDKVGNLSAKCPVCEACMHKRISVVKLSQIRGEIDIAFMQAEERISNSIQLTVNSDFN